MEVNKRDLHSDEKRLLESSSRKDASVQSTRAPRKVSIGVCVFGLLTICIGVLYWEQFIEFAEPKAVTLTLICVVVAISTRLYLVTPSLSHSNLPKTEESLTRLINGGVLTEVYRFETILVLDWGSGESETFVGLEPCGRGILFSEDLLDTELCLADFGLAPETLYGGTLSVSKIDTGLITKIESVGNCEILKTTNHDAWERSVELLEEMTPTQILVLDDADSELFRRVAGEARDNA